MSVSQKANVYSAIVETVIYRVGAVKSSVEDGGDRVTEFQIALLTGMFIIALINLVVVLIKELAIKNNPPGYASNR